MGRRVFVGVADDISQDLTGARFIAQRKWQPRINLHVNLLSGGIQPRLELPNDGPNQPLQLEGLKQQIDPAQLDTCQVE